MTTHIKTYFMEGTDGARAEVFEENGEYGIHYYMGIGEPEWFKREIFQGHSRQYAEDAAENWALGIKNLNG